MADTQTPLNYTTLKQVKVVWAEAASWSSEADDIHNTYVHLIIFQFVGDFDNRPTCEIKGRHVVC